MNRTVNIKVRLTEEERNHLYRCAQHSGTAKFKNGRSNFSEYLREELLRKSGYRDKETLLLLKDLQYELRKIGVNVNQIAKKINSGFGNFHDVVEIKDYLVQIKKAFSELEKEVKDPWASQG